MKYIANTLDFALERRSVITLGKFDGFHRGHQKLVKRILEIGKDGFETVIFTFDISPRIHLNKEAAGMLLTTAERAQLAHDFGVDCVVVCPFNEEVRNMAPEQFVEEILVEQLRAAYLVVGSDFRFGHGRRGTPQLLQELGPRYGFSVEIVEKEEQDDCPISSSWVREALKEGNMPLVNQLLGYTYTLRGLVVHGRKLGRKLGFPTINQVPDEQKLLPPFGVYVSRVYIHGKEYNGITNLGSKPTVDGSFVGIETYLYDCQEDLYGAVAEVQLIKLLRPEQKFPDIESLRKQLQKDIQIGKEFFG